MLLSMSVLTISGKVIVAEVDGIDMNKLAVNFVVVTADSYTTLSLRLRSSTCNCAPVSVATATACRVAIARVASRQAAPAHTLQSLALFSREQPTGCSTPRRP